MTHKINPKSRKPVQNNLFVMSPLFLVMFFYILLVGSGSGDQHGTTTQYYTKLADAFLDGNLHLTRIGKDIPIDLSFYEGKFYIYWGPVPALILVPIQFFFRKPVGDFFLAFTFGTGILLAQSLLLLAVWNRYFNSLPKWTIYLSILLGGLTEPIIFLRHNYDHARIYQAAIGGGQFFLMSGLLMAFTTITKPSISNLRHASAGLLWALAIGSRHILAAPIGFMAMLTAFLLVKTNADFIAKTAKLISLGLPLALGFAVLGWYNWARFDSITETGFSYALAGVNIREHSTELFSQVYIIQNLYNYLLNPPGLISNFPFISMRDGIETPILSFYTVPEFYHAEPMTGLLYIFPFAVFAIVPLITLFLNLFKEKSAKTLLGGNGHRLPAWIVLNLGGSILIAFGLLMGFFWVGIRYLGDFIPPLTVLSALGFWQGYRSPVRRPLAQNLYILSGIILASSSILISTLLAISTNSGLIDLIIHSFPDLR